MKELNKNYNVKIQIISPVHIGAGGDKDWFPGFHYFAVKNETVYVVSLEKIFAQLPESEYYAASNFFSQEQKWNEVIQFCKSRNIVLSKAIEHKFEIEVAPENEIKTLIRTGMGNPYIPGSSLKGAIRSALFGYLYSTEEDLKNFADTKIDQLKEKDKPSKRDISFASGDIDKKAFGEINTGLMRLIHVGDAVFKNTELAPVKIANRFSFDMKQGWKHAADKTTGKFSNSGFVNTLEILDENEEAEFRISFADEVFRLIEKYEKGKNAKFSNVLINDVDDPLSKLFEIINKYTRTLLNREIDYFKNNPNNDSETIIEFLEDYLDEIPDNNRSCLLRVGAGSGFHSITGDWRFEEHTSTLDKSDEDTLNIIRGRASRYKSRKLVFGEAEEDEAYVFLPMGFVKLSR